MPFGKYAGEGRKMENVPASYLLWLWDNGLYNFVLPRPPFKPIDSGRDAVRRYIIANAAALTTEASDTIVRHQIQ